MDVTSQRRCLGLLAAGLITGTAGAVGWAVSDIDPPQTVSSVDESQSSLSDLPVQAVSEQTSAVVAKQLRRPLYDPPPAKLPKQAPPPPRQVVKPPPKPQSTKLEVTLVGTIIESDQSLAIVSDAAGEFDVKGVGQSLELSPKGMKVESIKSESVTLSYKGQRSTIQLNRTQLKGNGGNKNRGNAKRRRDR